MNVSGNPTGGAVIFVPIADYDWGGPPDFGKRYAHDTKRRIEQMAAQGYTQENDAEVSSPHILQRTGAEEFRQMIDALSFTPVSIARGDLLEAGIGGDLHKPIKTSMHRIYSVETDVLSIYEQDFLTAPATWCVIKETMNTKVRAYPAALTVMDNSRGKVRVLLSWFTGRMAFTIQQWSTHADRHAVVQELTALAEEISR